MSFSFNSHVQIGVSWFIAHAECLCKKDSQRSEGERERERERWKKDLNNHSLDFMKRKNIFYEQTKREEGWIT